jgi:hypothetical protein
VPDDVDLPCILSAGLYSQNWPAEDIAPRCASGLIAGVADFRYDDASPMARGLMMENRISETSALNRGTLP